VTARSDRDRKAAIGSFAVTPGIARSDRDRKGALLRDEVNRERRRPTIASDRRRSSELCCALRSSLLLPMRDARGSHRVIAPRRESSSRRIDGRASRSRVLT
jgi:hypothetical protein